MILQRYVWWILVIVFLAFTISCATQNVHVNPILIQANKKYPIHNLQGNVGVGLSFMCTFVSILLIYPIYVAMYHIVLSLQKGVIRGKG